MKSRIVWVCLLSLVGACVITPTAGCGLDANQVSDQPSNQRNQTGVNQDTAAQGNTYVTLNNGAGGGGGGQAIPIVDGEGNIVGVTRAGNAGPGSAETGGQNATFSQVAYVNVQTGGTSATPTASNASGSQAQTPSQNATQTPTQHVEPKTSASVPVTVALPGGSASGNSTAALEGTSTANKQDQIDHTATFIKAQADKIKELEAIIKALQPAATTKPDELLELNR